MCGRIACTLGPDVICRACTYQNGSSGKFQTPTWQDHPSTTNSNMSGTYYPSANMAPTRFTPVMYKPKVKQEETTATGDENPDIVITPMIFGLIPAYHKGEAKNHGLSTNNARLEGIMDSKLYKPVLNKRQTCIIVAQGFYEWKTVGTDSKQKKQPYFIFPSQEENVKVADELSWNKEDNLTEENGWQGPKILKMAGIYDTWKSSNGDTVYSYTIITMGANKTIDWLHDRMPAILETNDQVMGWLNATPETDTKELISILTPATHLQWYAVDSKVGNSRCRDLDCMQPFLETKKDSKSRDMMSNWLKKADPKKPEKRKKDDDDEDSVGVEQKPKLE